MNEDVRAYSREVPSARTEDVRAYSRELPSARTDDEKAARQAERAAGHIQADRILQRLDRAGKVQVLTALCTAYGIAPDDLKGTTTRGALPRSREGGG